MGASYLQWGKRFTHPLMNDTGTLARSIQSEAGRTDIVGRRSDRTRIFRKGARYCMWTTEKSFPVKGKRGRSKERYGHYAAIHNTDPKFGLYTVNQYSTRRPVHRQFIGFSPKTDDYIAVHFIDMILKDFHTSRYDKRQTPRTTARTTVGTGGEPA